ncbi:Phosphomethylpyrimidine kinase [hydrothermal vent metagenome]|uniref:Phosphomethylpyrimidine kinase n=1 Tax=hydrothermal vent metagenome TaxID=652676 RepID=A0A1W1CMY5_9ZZZZ
MQDIEVFKKTILPFITLLIPNKNESLKLGAIIKTIPWVLITGGDDDKKIISHQLFNNGKLIKTFDYDKLPFQYHGSGCTLASSITALISQGLNIETACKEGLKYTYKTLINARKIAKHQYHPKR